MSNGIAGQDVRVIIAGEVGPPGAGPSSYLNVNDVTPSGTGPGDPFDDPQKAIDALGTLTLEQQGLVRVFPGTYPGDYVLPDFAHMLIVEPDSVLFTGSVGNQATPMITMSCCSSLTGALLQPQADKDIGILLAGGTSVDFRVLQDVFLHNFIGGNLMNEGIVVASAAGLDVLQFHNVVVLIATAGAAIRKETVALELNTSGCTFSVFSGGGKAVQHNAGNWFSRSDDFGGPIDLASGAKLFMTGSRYDPTLVTGEGTLVPSVPAESINYDNSSSGLSADQVQDAIDEVESNHLIESSIDHMNIIAGDGSDHADVASNTTHRGVVTSNPHVVTLEEARVAGNVLSGIIDMGTNKITNLATPTIGTDAASKDYVDSLVQGLSWQEPVISFLADPPGAPTIGDRYVVIAVATGAWTGQEDDIAEWNGTSWDFITPSDGFVVYRESDNRALVFADTAWITFGGIIQHAALIGAGTNTHAQIDTHLANIINPHAVTKAQVGLSLVENTLNNFTAEVNPVPTNDATEGYSENSHWINEDASIAFICVDPEDNGAIWLPVTPAVVSPASPIPTTNNPTTSSSTPVNMPQMALTRFVFTANSFALILGHATIAIDNAEEAEIVLAVNGSIVGRSGSIVIDATGGTTGQWNLAVMALVQVAEGSRTFSLQWFSPGSDTILNVNLQRNLVVRIINDFAV